MWGAKSSLGGKRGGSDGELTVTLWLDQGQRVEDEFGSGEAMCRVGADDTDDSDPRPMGGGARFYADYGVHTTIGEDTFINLHCVIIDDARIAIGRRVLIGPSVQLITATHPL